MFHAGDLIMRNTDYPHDSFIEGEPYKVTEVNDSDTKVKVEGCKESGWWISNRFVVYREYTSETFLTGKVEEFQQQVDKYSKLRGAKERELLILDAKLELAKSVLESAKEVLANQ